MYLITNFEMNRKCITCGKGFATERGLKKHQTTIKNCGEASKNIKKAQEIKNKKLRNSQIHGQKLKNIGPHKKLSVPHKRGAALTREEKETVLHIYESFRSKIDTQCRNYRNLFSHFFDKNFVKVMFLLGRHVIKKFVSHFEIQKSSVFPTHTIL